MLFENYAIEKPLPAKSLLISLYAHYVLIVFVCFHVAFGSLSLLLVSGRIMKRPPKLYDITFLYEKNKTPLTFTPPPPSQEPKTVKVVSKNVMRLPRDLRGRRKIFSSAKYDNLSMALAIDTSRFTPRIGRYSNDWDYRFEDFEKITYTDGPISPQWEEIAAGTGFLIIPPIFYFRKKAGARTS